MEKITSFTIDHIKLQPGIYDFSGMLLPDARSCEAQRYSSQVLR